MHYLRAQVMQGTTQRGRHWKSSLLLLTGAFLLLGILFRDSLTSQIGAGRNEVDYSVFALETATRGLFRVSLTERGQLDSMNNALLKNQVQGTTTILEILPEGTIVHGPVEAQIAGEVTKIQPQQSLGLEMYTVAVRGVRGKTVEHLAEMYAHTQILVALGDRVEAGDYLAGDVVCELDASKLVETEKQRRIAVTQAAANLEKARKNVEIRKALNESNLAAATLQRDLAQLDLRKYQDGDYQKTRDVLRGSLRAYQEELAKNRETYEFSRRNARKGYIPLKQLEEARLAVLKTQNQLASTEQELRVLEAYEYERQIKELTENALETERATQRVKLAGEAALAQQLADLKACELTYSVQLEKLKWLHDQIASCTLVAPQSGEIVYSSHGQGLQSGQPGIIEPGMTVWERQTLIKLPDPTQMKIDVRIHESKIGQISVGQRATISIDSIPNEIYRGEIISIASLPEAQNWPNFDLQEYDVEIRINNEFSQLQQLKPGLTAQVQLLIGTTRSQVLQIPVQALVTIGRRHFAYRIGPTGPERVELTIGESNDTSVEILEGIAEGDRVILQPRKHFQRELRILEGAYL